jgi:hypothetical protein
MDKEDAMPSNPQVVTVDEHPLIGHLATEGFRRASEDDRIITRPYPTQVVTDGIDESWYLRHQRGFTLEQIAEHMRQYAQNSGCGIAFTPSDLHVACRLTRGGETCDVFHLHDLGDALLVVKYQQ